MRTHISAAFLALAVTACTPGTSTDPSAIIAEVQKATATVCSFVPTAATIIALFNQLSPALKTGTDIAGAICAAVKPASGLAPSEAPKVGEVAIQGYHVR
jgi:hypothetical protein